eukprot:3220979-Pyramimonas_sp.AAC.1
MLTSYGRGFCSQFYTNEHMQVRFRAWRHKRGFRFVGMASTGSPQWPMFFLPKGAADHGKTGRGSTDD